MISEERLLGFCRGLTASVKSGLPLSDAFATLAKTGGYGRHIARAASMTAQGSFMHEAFSAQGIFPKVFIALLRAGEESGKTEEFLDVYADCLQVRIEFRRRIERLLLYPAFALAFALALLLFFSFKVIPLLLEPLIKAGAAVPRQILLVNYAAEKLRADWPPVMLAIVALILLGRWFVRSGPGRKLFGLAGHALPVFRFASSEARLYYQYTIMGLLFKAGVSLGAMMDILRQFSMDDLVSRGRFARAAEKVAGGAGFAESVAPLVPEEDRHSLEVAEKAGRLDDTLMARGRLHYDMHLHRMEMLVTAFNIATLGGLALATFALMAALVWPVLSALGGSGRALKNVLPSLELGASPSGTKAVPETPSGRFNRLQGGKVSGFILQQKTGGASSARKKLVPVGSGFGGLNSNDIHPTDIRPTDVSD